MTTDDDFAAHVNQMERDRQYQQSQERIADQERRAARWYAFMWVSIAGMVMAGLVGLGVVIWKATDGLSDQELMQQQDRQRCLEAGGTWTYVDATDDVTTCTMPGVSTR